MKVSQVNYCDTYCKTRVSFKIDTLQSKNGRSRRETKCSCHSCWTVLSVETKQKRSEEICNIHPSISGPFLHLDRQKPHCSETLFVRRQLLIQLALVRKYRTRKTIEEFRFHCFESARKRDDQLLTWIPSLFSKTLSRTTTKAPVVAAIKLKPSLISWSRIAISESSKEVPADLAVKTIFERMARLNKMRILLRKNSPPVLFTYIHRIVLFHDSITENNIRTLFSPPHILDGTNISWLAICFAHKIS
jgi:hypothetical protein